MVELYKYFDEHVVIASLLCFIGQDLQLFEDVFVNTSERNLQVETQNIEAILNKIDFVIKDGEFLESFDVLIFKKIHDYSVLNSAKDFNNFDFVLYLFLQDTRPLP